MFNKIRPPEPEPPLPMASPPFEVINEFVPVIKGECI